MLPYQNPQLPIEDRLDDLISRMTLEELIMQTDQFGPGDATEGEGRERRYSAEKVMKDFRGLIAILIGNINNGIYRTLKLFTGKRKTSVSDILVCGNACNGTESPMKVIA